MPTREEIEAEKQKLMAMPDEELTKLVPSLQDIAKEKKALESMSDEELNKIAFGIEPQKSFLERAGESLLGGIESVGKTFDSYTGAPTRAAFSELISTKPRDGQNPEDSQVLGNVKAAGQAYAKQFGQDPSLAPTGKDIAQNQLGISGGSGSVPIYKFVGELTAADKKAIAENGIKPDAQGRYQVGVKETASPAGAVGAVLDVALDPTNFIPFGTVAKGVEKAVKGTTGAILKGSYNAAKAVAPTAVGITENVAKGLTRSVDRFINPKIADDFGALKAIAEKNNITNLNSASVEFGQDSFIDLLSRSRMQSGAAEEALARFRQGQTEIKDAIENRIKSIGGSEQIMDKAQAGQYLANALQEAKSRVLGATEDTYTLIGRNNPGMKLSADAENKVLKGLSEIETKANRLSKGTASQRGQAANLMDNVNAVIRAGNNYDDHVIALQNLGKEAYPQTAKGLMERDPDDLKALRTLYTTMKESLTDTISKNVSPEVAKNLIENNKKISKFFDDASIFGNDLSKLEHGKMGAEQLFSKYIERGNTSGINALKDILTPEQFNQLKAAYLDGFIARKIDDNFNLQGIRNALTSSDNKLRTSAILEPEEFKDMTDLILLGDRYGSAILNTSGTERTRQVTKGIKDAIGDAVSNETLLQWLKQRARAPKDVPKGPQPPRFGPAAIGKKEALGLRLPQQISIQQNNNKER